jgi:Helix-turn-helix domain
MHRVTNAQRYAPEGAEIPSGLRDEWYAASFLGVSVDTLRTWRKRGSGPRYRKIGAKCVRYSPHDLAAFVESCPTGGAPEPAA